MYIRTENCRDEGVGPRPAYYFLNVDLFVKHIVKINAAGTRQIVAQVLLFT